MRILNLLFILFVIVLFVYSINGGFAEEGLQDSNTQTEQEIEELPEFDPEELLPTETEKEKKSISLSGRIISDSSVGIERDSPYVDSDALPGFRELENSETLRLRLVTATSDYIKGVVDGGFIFYPYGIPGEGETEAIDLFLIEAYTQISFRDVLFLKAGLQHVDWSIGYIWSTTGRLNRIRTPLSPMEDQSGVVGLTFETLSRHVSYTFGLVFPSSSLEGENIHILSSWWAHRLLFSFGNTSIVIDTGIRFDPDASLNDKVSDFFIAGGVNQELAGFLLYTDFGTFYSESLSFDTSGMRTEELEWNFGMTLGFNRRIFKDGFIIFEYNYNSAGYSWEDMKNLATALQSADPNVQEEALSALNPGEMEHHHLYIHYLHTIRELIEVSLDTIIGFTAPKGSGDQDLLPTEYISSEISYIGFRNTRLSLYSTFFLRHGDDDFGEFALIPFSNVSGLKLELYF